MSNDDTLLHESIQHLRGTIEPKRLQLYDRIAKERARYFGFGRDDELENALEGMVASVVASSLEDGRVPDKRRIVAVTGLSGAGKSRAVSEHIARWECMRPRIDRDGIEIRPLLIFEAPSPCTPLLLAIEGLRALGIDVAPRIRENQAWHEFRVALESHRVHYVFIDEAQHTIDTANKIEKQKISNTFKTLVQMPWPVRLILAGVPPLADFLAGSPQLHNRMTPIPFEPFTGKEGLKLVKEHTKEVIEGHFRLRSSSDLDDDAMDRLFHVYAGQFGSTIDLVRRACANVLLAGRKVVQLSDFVTAYALVSGCQPHENIFDSDHWSDLDIQTALLREADMEWRVQNEKPKSKKSLKFGDRP